MSKTIFVNDISKSRAIFIIRNPFVPFFPFHKCKIPLMILIKSDKKWIFWISLSVLFLFLFQLQWMLDMQVIVNSTHLIRTKKVLWCFHYQYSFSIGLIGIKELSGLRYFLIMLIVSRSQLESCSANNFVFLALIYSLSISIDVSSSLT